MSGNFLPDLAQSQKPLTIHHIDFLLPDYNLDHRQVCVERKLFAPFGQLLADLENFHLRLTQSRAALGDISGGNGLHSRTAFSLGGIRVPAQILSDYGNVFCRGRRDRCQNGQSAQNC